MQKLARGAADRELRRMVSLYLQAETDIINEIGRLRSLGLVDYHAVAALERVQQILRQLESDCWSYAPRMLEAQFYVIRPEARKPLEGPESPGKHLLGYKHARALTSEQADIVQRLTMSLMGQIIQANATAQSTLEEALLGRRESDIFRRAGLEQTALLQASGGGVYRSLGGLVERLRREGVTAFTDRAGRRWSLHTYGGMVLRSTSRQAEVLAVLTQNPGHDLYQISKHGSTCPLCAPLEGRVYSKSGRDPDFPPLAAAFGKMDPAGPDDLANSWLNIHPNCLHHLRPWTPMGRSEEEIRKIREFSSFESNPVTRDPRTQRQIDAYRQKERSRARRLRDYRQWERYRETLGDPVPSRFETFLRHKAAGDERYKEWKRSYRRQNRLDNPGNRDILEDTRYKAIPVTDEAIQRVPQIRPQGWTTEQAERLQEAHRDLLRAVQSKPVGTEAGRIYRPDMSPISQLITGETGRHQVSLPSCEVPHIIIHSHPDGQVFSGTDIRKFISSSSMEMMTAVGNNGTLYIIRKTSDYDGFQAYRQYLELETILQKAVSEGNMDDYICAIADFVTGGNVYGLEFIKSGA